MDPTVGRIVHFYYNQKATELAAIVASINSDGTLNLGVFHADGSLHGNQRVPLVQDGKPPEVGPFCVWMPYQLAVNEKIKTILDPVAPKLPPAAAVLGDPDVEPQSAPPEAEGGAMT